MGANKGRDRKAAESGAIFRAMLCDLNKKTIFLYPAW
jgi:hypothetical protein